MLQGADGELIGIIDGLPIGDSITPWSIVIFLVLMLFTGRLFTKRQYDDCREDLKLARATNEAQAETLREISKAVAVCVETGKTTVHILREIQGKAHQEAETP